MTSARRHRDGVENVDHAALDDELHRLLQQHPVRQRLRDVLIARWFTDVEAGARAVLGERAAEKDVERALRTGEAVANVNASIRSSVFRRMVLEAYDYRCAGTGLRLVVPGVAVLLDGAHLIPFGVSGNDAPTNGIALTATFHRVLVCSRTASTRTSNMTFCCSTVTGTWCLTTTSSRVIIRLA